MENISATLRTYSIVRFHTN